MKRFAELFQALDTTTSTNAKVEALQRYRHWLRDDEHCLVHLAVRTQGLFVAAGNPKGIRGVADLARADVRFVNRPEGSGTRLLTELLLERAGLAPTQVRGFDDTELTHAAVAAYKKMDPTATTEIAVREIGKQMDPPRQGEMLLRLARVYEEEIARKNPSGGADKAIATYRRVLEVEPEQQVAILALDRLYQKTARYGDLADILERDLQKKRWKDIWSAGQGVGIVDRKASIAEIVARFEAQYRSAWEQAVFVDR